jgi:hypothetical protein
MKSKSTEDKAPKGGWKGPPDTTGLEPIAIAVGSKKGQWIWKPNKLSEKQKAKHKKFQKKMAKADKKDIWRF